ncbi:MAG: hypothetical protein ACLP8S_08815 [Solirubrobacteraceae bacterium]
MRRRFALILSTFAVLAVPPAAAARTLTGQVLAVYRSELSVVTADHSAASYRYSAHLPAGVAVAAEVRLAIRSRTVTRVAVLCRSAGALSFYGTVLSRTRSQVTVTLADGSRYVAVSSSSSRLRGNTMALKPGLTVLLILTRTATGALTTAITTDLYAANGSGGTGLTASPSAVASCASGGITTTSHPKTAPTKTAPTKTAPTKTAPTKTAPTKPVVQTVTGTVTAVGSGALTIRSSAGQSETFQATAGMLFGLQAGELAQVVYTQNGALTAQSVTPEGSSTAAQITGTITQASQSSVTIQPSIGTALTISTGGQPALLDGYLPGDTVLAIYTASASGKTPVAEQVHYTTPREAGEASGSILAVGASSLLIQRPARNLTAIAAMQAVADDITQADYTYVWGGGHQIAGLADIGDVEQGSGANGTNIGYDCSGAVGAVLEAGGLWPAGTGVPNDAGVIADLLQNGVIAPGAGSGQPEVTLYDYPGVHIFMNINGAFFGTSDGHNGNATQPEDGAGWLNDNHPDTSNKVFKQYHVLPSLLTPIVTYAPTLAFLAGKSLLTGATVGQGVQVGYTETPAGTPIAHAVTLVGQ